MRGDTMAKRSSFGKSIRKRLSDITNHQPQPKSPQVFDQNLSSCSTKEHIDHLLKENEELMRIVIEKNKIIELNGVELQKLRTGIQKTQLQNWNLAQTNSIMMAELNFGKRKLKTLEHQLSCKDALLKSMNLEIQTQHDQKGGPQMKDDDNVEIKQQTTNKLIRPIRSQSIASLMTEVKRVSEKDNDNVETRQQTTNKLIRPIRSQSIGSLMTAVKRVSEKEIVENKRRCVRRQSARFRSQEHEPNENLFEIKDLKMHEDVPTSNEQKDENHSSKPESRESQRMSFGRPSRRAAEKIQSYKEIPLNMKMRRPE